MPIFNETQALNCSVFCVIVLLVCQVTPANPVALRPLEELAELRAQGLSTKVVHFVRHGEGTHNVEKDYKYVSILWVSNMPYSIELDAYQRSGTKFP